VRESRQDVRGEANMKGKGWVRRVNQYRVEQGKDDDVPRNHVSEEFHT